MLSSKLSATVVSVSGISGGERQAAGRSNSGVFGPMSQPQPAPLGSENLFGTARNSPIGSAICSEEAMFAA